MIAIRDFDAEEQALAPPAPPVDLEAARAEARAEGYAEGYAAGEAEGRRAAGDAQQAQVRAAITALGEAVPALYARAAADRADLEARLLDILVEIGCRLRPAYVAAHGRDWLRERAREIVEAGLRDPGLRVFLPPDLAGEAGDELAALLVPAVDGIARPEIVADGSLSGHALRASWRDGVMTAQLETVCAGIEEALTQAAAQARAARDEHPAAPGACGPGGPAETTGACEAPEHPATSAEDRIEDKEGAQ